ncbi:major facilitator superfamily domain-containing protein [Suillus plorans]|uniref:Major facilitator superfamily domain-containing protein n=1 Tax=Suillus plorans TaxID=116603 RepID=A0A9P7DLQ0_9AGAM|nr:major facilitator superfamily domain-containing protein [Suillus plorans]KAG1797872.1 major facilitator superfamily domain-containing protein [Suillus plorans]
MIESQSTTLSSTEVQSVEFREIDIQTHVSSSTLANEPIKLDIEHAVVEDDPRIWSNAKKNVVLVIISGASMIAGLCANIQNPANAQIEQQLHTNGENISLSLSLFILIQGNFPVMWSAISEIKGRKIVYLFSIALFTLGSVIVAISRTIGVLIGMRILQGAGSSAVIAIGAATLADIYEPHQRGKMMGVYYSAPLLGPSLGPIIGGALTQGLGWRAVFWFLVIWGGIIFSAFLFLLKDTFRKERSVTYQNVLKRRLREQQSSEAKDDSGNISEKELRVNDENQTNPKDIEAQPAVIPALAIREVNEAQPAVIPALAIREVKLSIADVNPFPPYLSILSRKNNFVILIPSGLIFAFSFSIAYTCARTLSMYYNYDALKTGLVLLAYGIGSVTGSILGGRWSDRTLARLKAANGGISFPEMRLESTKVAMVWLPLSVIGYGWVCQERVNVAAICVMLFLAGFLSIWIYTSTLAYIVDANTGRSSTAVATNSSFRGLSAFVAAEIAVPLQDSIGDGGLYTLWAGLLVIANCIILLVLYKGRKWREASVEREKQKLDGK